MSNINKQERQVSRFDLVSGYMQKLPDGEYVFHTDYQALLDELEDANKAAESGIEWMKRHLAAEKRIAELELRLSQQQSIAANNLDMFRRADARVSELEAREVKLPDVEKWRSPEAVRAQNAYRVLVGQELSAAGIITKVGE